MGEGELVPLFSDLAVERRCTCGGIPHFIATPLAAHERGARPRRASSSAIPSLAHHPCFTPFRTSSDAYNGLGVGLSKSLFWFVPPLVDPDARTTIWRQSNQAAFACSVTRTTTAARMRSLSTSKWLQAFPSELWTLLFCHRPKPAAELARRPPFLTLADLMPGPKFTVSCFLPEFTFVYCSSASNSRLSLAQQREVLV